MRPDYVGTRYLGLQSRGFIKIQDINLSYKLPKGIFKSAGVNSLGCDVVLHCNGDMAEMEAVAKEAVVLSGRELARSEAVLALLAQPSEHLDIDSALVEFAEIMGLSGEDRWG